MRHRDIVFAIADWSLQRRSLKLFQDVYVASLKRTLETVWPPPTSIPTDALCMRALYSTASQPSA